MARKFAELLTEICILKKELGAKAVEVPAEAVKPKWNAVLAQSSPPDSRMALSFHPPQVRDSGVVVCPPSAVAESGAEQWCDCVVGYFLDKKLPFPVVKSIVMKIWKKFGIYDVMANDQGFYFFKFGQDGAFRKVIEAGPWHIAGQLMILKQWQPQKVLQKEQLSSIPIWVQVSNVPLEFWNAEGFSYIPSALGKPLYADAQTEKGQRLSFAKIYVEIHVDSPLLNTVEVEYANGETVTIDVKYPWKPLSCTKCHVFGHSEASHKESKDKEEKVDERVTAGTPVEMGAPILPDDLGIECGGSPVLLGAVEIPLGASGSGKVESLIMQKMAKDSDEVCPFTMVGTGGSRGKGGSPSVLKGSPRDMKDSMVVMKDGVAAVVSLDDLELERSNVSKGLFADKSSLVSEPPAQLSNTFAILDSTLDKVQSQVDGEGVIPVSPSKERALILLLLPLRRSRREGQREVVEGVPLLGKREGGDSLLLPMMKIAAWNIRGLNNPLKQKEVCSFIQSQKLCFMSVVETKVRRDCLAATAVRSFPSQWSFFFFLDNLA